VNFGEGEVAVDDVDLVAVALGDGGEEAIVEAAAEGALEVVEVDDDDGSGGRAATRGTASVRDHGAGVGGDVVLDELGDGLAVVGDQEFYGVRGLVVGREGDVDGVKAGNVRGLHRTDGDGGSGRQLGLATQQNFYVMRQGGREGGAGLELGRGRVLGMATEGSEEGGEEKSG
jgi:hypothetical protein